MILRFGKIIVSQMITKVNKRISNWKQIWDNERGLCLERLLDRRGSGDHARTWHFRYYPCGQTQLESEISVIRFELQAPSEECRADRDDYASPDGRWSKTVRMPVMIGITAGKTKKQFIKWYEDYFVLPIGCKTLEEWEDTVDLLQEQLLSKNPP